MRPFMPSFHTHGVVAIRDKTGEPRFNFRQTIWVYPGVTMRWSPRPSRAVETLAVNILVLMPQIRLIRHTRPLAGRFARDFLLTMPLEGGRIPREVIREWLREH